MIGIVLTKGRWLVIFLIYFNVIVCDFICVKLLIVCVVDDGVLGKGLYFIFVYLSF